MLLGNTRFIEDAQFNDKSRVADLQVLAISLLSTFFAMRLAVAKASSVVECGIDCTSEQLC